MKSYDLIACEHEPSTIDIPDIPLFRYTPTLQQELDENRITADEAIGMYEAMVLQRNFEFMVRDLDTKRLVPYEGYTYRGTSHLSFGQEATAIGATAVLKREDYITSNHRGHGHCLGKGLYALLAMAPDALKEFVTGAEANEFSIEKRSVGV